MLFLIPPVWRSQIEAHEIHHVKGRDVRLSFALALSTIQIIPHPPLPQIQKERFSTKLPFNFSLDVKSMKISSSEVESPSGVS
ncbi:hypothetical protein TNCV_4006641 [Trichonephila clavipes]|nr:hypothetical protein TNCV_4006641 [Trichonephila clavipes]